ncbi:hypothetical protein GCM10023186_29170 [Hymenobacter koreensis]|uniref:Transcriptional regulator n=2 Tax=Hymenobacter koreensis TaxID=1084523 RepID=A0ABP8J5W5_9BACT
MYSANQSRQQVEQMLVSEGADCENAPQLALSYYKDYLYLALEEQKKRRKKADGQIVAGTIIMLCSVALTLIVYWGLNGNDLLVYYGATVCGIALLIKGITEKNAANSNSALLTEKLKSSQIFSFE